MTLNVRQADGDDAEHAWANRKQTLVEVVGDVMPTLLGTQEAHPEQIEYILKYLPRYKAVGQGRFGDDRDKHNKIFFLKDRVSLIEAGDVWFSETPDIPGTTSWGIPRPRSVTWALLSIEGHELFILNTHLPYGRHADGARRESAQIIMKLVNSWDPARPVILTGDFNSPPNGDVHRMLTTLLSDSWLTALQQRGPEYTVHGFGKFAGPSIDWILYRGCRNPIIAEILPTTKYGLYPPDHYPVLATLEL